MTEREINGLEKFLSLIEKYGLVVATFIFSIFAKFYIMYKYRTRLTGVPCFIEVTITILGAAISIYVIHQMELSLWLTSLLGGFSGVVISPLANAISKNTPIILDKVAKKVMDYIDSFKPK